MNKISINNPYFITQLIEGNHNAYETLFHLYFEKLHYVAVSYIENTEDAKEIIQNIFLKVWKKKQILTPEMNLNAYLFKMVKNECLDYLKHTKVQLKYRKKLEIERAYLNEKALKNDPSQLLIESELQNKIEGLINQLPANCREVFIKSRIEGLKYAEIANELNISVKTVENQISKALRYLRHELQEYMGLFL
ncbi:RNA polymerase sigma-70 factor [Imtechella halotolerans]|uniref:RNA polymerase ECF-type sigma factor n=1 Tax=Imtechella halotolerans K1 TaxID=946077 RepID=I0WJ39_9FLAO|nr:RNA polymerase sigma-70 factor [Imtechella halotolerans]EID76405.1 RNA polymerase ECF-type sigma factor [Imtechella halotolerans K1]WMQ63023.1 RNA polymerase sigma-70 factor [Imtechella halotolerans]